MFFITVTSLILLAMLAARPLVSNYNHINNESGRTIRKQEAEINIIQQQNDVQHPSRKYSNNSSPIAMTMSYWNNFIPDWLSKGHPVDLDEANNPIINRTILPYNFTATNSSSTCPKFFRAYIKDPKPFYQICDILEYVIEARDCDGIKLSSGGDYI